MEKERVIRVTLYIEESKEDFFPKDCDLRFFKEKPGLASSSLTTRVLFFITDR